MDDSIEEIYKVISSYIDISDEEWLYYASALKIENVRRKEILLNEGDPCSYVYFVAKGLLRIYFVDKNGDEKTFHFSLENTFAADYESFLKNLPSKYSIQAMEDTVLVKMSLEMLLEGYDKLRNGEKLGRLLAQDYFFIFSEKIQSLYTQTPLERYNNLNSRFKNIIQRVPQHYIASYLNISSVHLSRLKN